MTTFYSDMEALSKYSPVMVHLFPATRILSENPETVKHFPYSHQFGCLLTGGLAGDEYNSFI